MSLLAVGQGPLLALEGSHGSLLVGPSCQSNGMPNPPTTWNPSDFPFRHVSSALQSEKVLCFYGLVKVWAHLDSPGYSPILRSLITSAKSLSPRNKIYSQVDMFMVGE